MTAGWSGLFDTDPGYLDTAAVGVPPRAAADAVQQVLDDWRRGRTAPGDFDSYVARARAAWASLSGVDVASVAIGATVSGLVAPIAAGLPAGAQVLVAAGEFSSLLFPFLAQESRGVRVREAPVDRLAESLDDGIDLVAVSAVQSADGRVTDIDALLAAASRHGAKVLLDTTQSCGWLPLDCSGIDYTVCAAYKWLLSPRGVAFLSVRPEHLDALPTHAAGWYAGQDVWSSLYGSPLRLSSDARRLDTSPAWLSWTGAAVALELLASLDAAAVHRHAVGLAGRFLTALGAPSQGSAIATVELSGAADRLGAAGIRASVRAGRVRASFHLYNTDDDVDAAVAALTGSRPGRLAPQG